MSYSWVFLGDFEIPAERLDAATRLIPPTVTGLPDIRRDAELDDAIYRGTRLHLRQVFEKSQYAERVEELENRLESLVGCGATGEGIIVGFVDGPTDCGDRFVLADGTVEQSELSEDEADAAGYTDAFEAAADRFSDAFTDLTG
ncbi:MAG: hypothetical protein GXX79_07840 [Actinomycetales bacterium]|nr:hypothetical protein [Actinomycetales bacterium]